MQVRIEDTTLKAIADKVREKNHESDTYAPSEMPDAIDRIIVTEMVIEPKEITANGTYEAPEGVDGYNPITVDVPPNVTSIDITANGTYTAEGVDGYNVINVNTPVPTDEELTFSGNIDRRFYGDQWTWFLVKYGDRMRTSELNNIGGAFANSPSIVEIPFQINIYNCDDLSQAFYYCSGLKTCPKIRGTVSWGTSTDFSSILEWCTSLRDVEDLFTPDMLEGFSTVKITNQYLAPKPATFRDCRSLRSIPSWWYKFKFNEESTSFPNQTYSLYNYMLNGCYSLDEAINIHVWRCQAAQTSNMFNNSFSICRRLKNITFETNEDGSAIETNWKTQTIDLSSYVGYTNSTSYILDYNNGITADKQVKDDATYQALKDDPDWFTSNIAYSRYNHDSAVATINSLPDTSAYLATAGGTNTIKFKGGSGSATDGGAINTLTEEEIAVAAAKGWTVTLS